MGLFASKTAVVAANRPDINNCEQSKLTLAKDTCKAKEHKFIPSMSCLIDVCFGGDQFADEDGCAGGSLRPDEEPVCAILALGRSEQCRPSSGHPVFQSNKRCTGRLQGPHRGLTQ